MKPRGNRDHVLALMEKFRRDLDAKRTAPVRLLPEPRENFGEADERGLTAEMRKFLNERDGEA